MDKIINTVKMENSETTEIYDTLRDTYKQIKESNEKFNLSWDRLKEKCSDLKKDLKSIDDESLDILHYLELTPCDCIKLVKIARELKEVRLKRRKIKNELELAESTLKILDTGRKNLPELSESFIKSYEFKTSIIDKI